LLHGIITIAIIKLVYKDYFFVRIGALLTTGVVLAYVGTNLVGRLGNLVRMQAMSLEIAAYASSPLLTILLISALTLAKSSDGTPDKLVTEEKRNRIVSG
jgi:hypothetical protein